MAEEIILRVTELRANLAYSKSGISTEPVGDLLYVVEVPDEGYRFLPDGTKVFTADGIQHILKGLHVSLVLDSDREDF